MNVSDTYKDISAQITARVNWSYLVIIILISLLAKHGIWRVVNLKVKLDEVVLHRNLKIELTGNLLSAAYNRHNTLVRQTLTDDPFERDDVKMQYHKWGFEVGKARNSFRAMTLDSFEKENFSKQNKLIEEIVVLQDKVVELAATGKTDDARRILTERLIEFDSEFDGVLAEMQDYQRERINGAASVVSAAVINTIIYNLIIAFVSIALIIAIALRVRKFSSRQSQVISEKVTELDAAHDRINELLHSILPANIVKRIHNGEKLIVDKFDQSCIIFSDIVGFTALSSKLEPAELVQLLDKLFSAFDKSVKKYGVEKIKTIGDAYMAINGGSLEESKNAALFSLSMVKHAEEISKETGLDISIRVGLHIGPIIAGVIGGERPVFDCWGNSVNMAARLEQSAKTGKVHVSEAVKQWLADEFHFEGAGTHQLKGIGSVTTWNLSSRQ